MSPAVTHLRQALDAIEAEFLAVAARRRAIAATLALFDAPLGDELVEVPSDWVEVGTSLSDGQPMRPAYIEPEPEPEPVVEQFAVAKAVIDAEPATPKRGGGRPGHDYAKVAEIARQAQADGQPMDAAVAEALGITKNAAGQAISKARQKGHEINAVRRGSPGPRPTARAPWTPADAQEVIDRVG